MSRSGCAVGGRKDLDLAEAKGFFELVELRQSVLTATLPFFERGRRDQGRRGWWRGRGWTETNATDVEVLLEAIELQEIGELERSLPRVGFIVSAFGCPLTVTGFEVWKNGPSVD